MREEVGGEDPVSEMAVESVRMIHRIIHEDCKLAHEITRAFTVLMVREYRTLTTSKEGQK